ncbi:acyl-CoA dehydrogenase family protein [Streptomyces sp. NPDC045470]|uniref:acyl-CoA dehydrogenase family protein n=1 Tax=Streptomyces sp. NPDC045470 TaxID=3155469 RepID=UPI0033C4BD0F
MTVATTDTGPGPAEGAGAARAAEAAVRERVARLERGFGDLDDPGNPLGTEQFVRADAERRLLPAAEALLDGFRLQAEIVPRELGGRLGRLDVLARVLRAVFRRDAALGLACGTGPYLAAAAVWAGGSARQRHRTADLLLSGGRMACAYPQPAEGNAFLHNGFTVSPDGAGYLLDGRKEALNNAARAASLLLFARVDEPGGGGHRAFLIDAPQADAPGFRLLPRRSTTGVRGCLVHGLEFTRYPVTADRQLGPGTGTGAELAARAFPVIRSTGPSMALGCADTTLRTAVAFARAHRARSRASVRAPRTRQALQDAFSDLLLCDALALVATRAAHLLPRESATLSAVAKYLLPMFLTESAYDLSAVLGAESYARQGAYAVFRKALRDLPMIGLGPVGSEASRAAVADRLLRLPGLRPPPVGAAGAALFQWHEPGLPALRPREFVLPAEGDSLVGGLEETVERARAAGGGELDRTLAGYATALGRELDRLRRDCALLGRSGGPARPRVYALVDRYALIAAGAACLGVWRYRTGPDDGLPAGPAWAVMALARVLRRLDPAAPRPPASAAEPLLTELLNRFDDARSFDLYATPIGR